MAFASPAAQTEKLPACCRIVTEVVYVNPKPAYPKDIRQYTRVEKTVKKIVCSAPHHASCCPGK